MDRDGSSTQLREEEEEAEAAALKADESAVGMVKEAMEDSAKQIQTKVKMGLT